MTATDKYKEILNLFEREELIVIEATKWAATTPWEHKSTIIVYNDLFYRISERRKWRSDGFFEYGKEEIVQVRRAYKTKKVVKITWKEVNE